MSTSGTRNVGATKAGGGRHVFDLPRLARIEAGPGYSTSEGPVVEGERIQVGLITMRRGTGARAHSHPNEQWMYVLQGKGRAWIEGSDEQPIGPGSLVFFPANAVHWAVASAEEDLVFFTCKDLSHGIVGTAADGKMTGPHYEPGFGPG
jgi:quercetin dioxygenase-like cupin family protein